MAQDPREEAHWFDAFKKANEGPPGPSALAGSASSAGERPSERRVKPRFEIDDAEAVLQKDGLLTVLGLKKGNQSREALDLSESGARFLTHERIAPGTRVKVLIHLEKFKDSIEAGGEVRWCYESAKKPGDFYAGVQFVDIDPSQARKIAAMRDWFNSPQYRAVRETKLRQRKSGGDGLIVPK